MRIILKTSLFLLIPTIFVFLPFLANPNLLLSRNNDLTEFFWPVFYFLKQNILVNHQIPTTNTMWFAGTNLLGDPQNPIWYLPNIIFLFTDIDIGILLSLFGHTLFGALGMYITSKKVFGFSRKMNILVSCLFILSPIYFSFLEAGHWGLLISWSWIPYLILSSYNLAGKPNIKYVLLFAVSFSSVYFNHILTGTIFLVFALIYWLYKKSILYPLFAVLLTLLIISPALYYQLSWLPTTTRNLLVQNPETYPIWRGKREFAKTIFAFNPETEKAITIGVVPSILAFLGFVRLKTKSKLLLSALIFFLTLIALNNVSPVFQLLLKIDFFLLARVAIRVWPIVFLALLFLAGRGMERVRGKLGFILGVAAIVESAVLGYSYLRKPISVRENIPQEIYKIFESDGSDYRILCLTRCISQKEAATRNLKLVEGYGTLQSLDYYYAAQKALNASWSKYTLAIPPFDVYLYQKLQPDPFLLAQEFNTKYVISKHKLKEPSFKLVGVYGIYYLYINTQWF